MNILISVDKNYLDKAETMLFSLKRNTEEAIAVYLLNRSLQKDQILRFEQYLKKECGAILTVIDMDPAFFDAFPVNAYFSIEMYYRILAQFLLPESLDRILWLDADIIIKKDIGTFYHQSFDGMKYVVCPDIDKDSWTIKIQKERLGIPDEHLYFNSGVMLMNLTLLRQETDKKGIVQKCMELKDKLLYPDQDLLNAIYAGQIKYADMKTYNYQYSGLKKMPKADSKNATVLHYVSYHKPWNYHYMDYSSRYYWKTRFAQGHRLETVKNYALAIMFMTYSFFSNVKNLFF